MHTEARCKLIKYQHRFIFRAELAHRLQEVELGLFNTDGFHNHGSHRMLSKDALERIDIVINEAVRKRTHRCWDTLVARGRANVPVVPAVITAEGKMVAASVGSRRAHRTSSGIRAVLGKSYHFVTRH